MSWWQAVMTVFLGNLIVLVPMLLIGHAGAKYGIPYAVLARASFGTQGAKLPAMLRAWWPAAGTASRPGSAADDLHLAGRDLGHRWRARRSLAWASTWRSWCASGVLGHPVLLCGAWHRVHPQAGNLDRAAEDRDLLRAAGLGLPKGRRLRPHLDQPSQFDRAAPRPGSSGRVLAFADRHGGLLGHAGAEHPGLHPLCRSQRDQVVGQAIGLPVPMGLLAAWR
jgi:NCS1 family nucleobase:cation symporter-1